MPDFVAFDLETTGLSPKSDQIIEIGAVRFGLDGASGTGFDVLVDPGIPIPLAIERLTGIGRSDVAGAPSPAEAVAQFADFCDGAELIAHGSAFDLSFCAGLLPGAFAGRAVYDTLELARILMPLAASHSLPLLSAALGIGHRRPHRADSDALATGELFLRLLDTACGLDGAVLRDIGGVLEDIRAPLTTFFRSLVPSVAGRPGATHPAPVAIGTAGPEPATGGSPVPAPPHRHPLRDGESLESAVAGLLGPSGPLAATPGYEFRAGQVEMARAVAQTLERNGRLMVEAGTGVGKSRAYLAPLLLWSRRTGRRGVIATNTVTLQEQLAEHDVPALLAHIDAPLTVAMLKGRQHYVSLRRWHRFLSSDDHAGHHVDLDRIRFKLKVLCWLTQTTTGDRGELRLATVEEPFWRHIQSDSDDCLGSACANWRSAACHMVAARRQAAAAGIVVTNHALLLADAERQGRVLYDYSAVVIDEAHRFEEAATRQLGSTLRATDLIAILERLPDPQPGGDLDAALGSCHDAVTRVFGDTKGFLAGAFGSDQPVNGTLGLTAEVRDRRVFAVVAKSARHCVRSLRHTSEALLAARGTAAADWSLLPQPERADDELAVAASALDEAAATIERVLYQPRDGYVAWLQLRAEQPEIHEAPIHVAELLRDTVFDTVDAAVLTSATMSVGRSFDFIRDRTGIGGGAEELTVESPFDFLAQALSIVPTDIPHFEDERYDAAMAKLCIDIAGRLGGRTLVLFTGYGPLRRVHALIRSRLEARGIVVLGQGLDGTRRQILGNFLANPRTILLGTTTFWEGIDVTGDGLSCVVIAKLPFPVPTDPLVQARGVHLRDPFAELSLPTAVIRLKQGFGRLIRHRNDQGVVVLCDARISTREYGRQFMAALPPAHVAGLPLASVGVAVESFLRDGTVPAAGLFADSGRAVAVTRPGGAATWHADEPA